jgi:signal transduction histidine kinase
LADDQTVTDNPIAVAIDPVLALGAAAHEIKNALGPLAVTLELAERRLQAGGAATADELAFARAQVKRLGRLVNDLLDVTRVDLGRFTLDRKPQDITELVDEAAGLFGRAHGRALTVTHAREPEPMMADLDRDRLLQVLLNLLENAARYAPVPAPVELAVERAAAVARVSVRDHGPGLALDDQRRVFEPLYRARATAAGQPGLGLGLYLCRVIVEGHGGRIGVDSAPGAGANFWIEVPLA